MNAADPMQESPAPTSPAACRALFFDGSSSRRHAVRLGFGEQLEISAEDGSPLASWAYADLRRLDAPAGTLRLGNTAAAALARLEIRDTRTAAEVTARCSHLDANAPGRHSVGRIVAWSLAAAVSVVLITLYGLPLIAERLTPLLPESFERRLGDVAEQQVKAIFGDKVCDNPAGQAAFVKLVDALRGAAGLDRSVVPSVLSSGIANAIALPGGKVFLFSALLDKANDPDEIAGVIAHEFGHVAHRDNMRGLIHNGGTSFLIGLLFGDITGSGALIFTSRTLITSSYSRETEQNADTYSIDVMRRLGRSPTPMGELLFRVTGKEGGSGLGILSSHPLTEDRLARMKQLDAPPRGAPLLTPQEWAALKAICAPR
jgi:Zn-dependent protease with chaperone function